MDSVVPDYILESVRTLPPLPAAVNRLLALAKDVDSDFREISKIVESDQTLTARTLRAANSAMYGVPRQVQTVRQATVLLGRDTVINLALGVSVLSMQAKLRDQWPMDPEAFWKHSIAVATTARMMANRLGSPDPEEAFVAGLLHDIGKLVMLNHYGDLYAQVLMAAQYGTKPLHILEREIFETDHAQVGHALCLHWNIPTPLTRAVAEHHTDLEPAPNSVAFLVRDANTIIKSMQFGNSGNQYAEIGEPDATPHNHIHPDRLRAMVLELPYELEEAEHVFVREDPHGPTAQEPASRATRPYMHVAVDEPGELEIVKFSLLSLGFDPQPAPENGLGGDLARLVGLVTDQPSSRQAKAYEDRGLEVFDYGTWRTRTCKPSYRHLNVYQLHQWLGNALKKAEQEDAV